MFISKREKRDLWQEIEILKECTNDALGRLTAQIEDLREALNRNSQGIVERLKSINELREKIKEIRVETIRLEETKEDKVFPGNPACAIARIKASENGRFVYDDRTGKVLPVITGIGDAQRELAAEAVKNAQPITREELAESRAEYEKLLRHAEKAAAPKRKPEPIADEEPALFTQAQREKVRRYYDLNFEILNALKIDRVKNGMPGTAVYLNRRKNGNSTACRFAEKHAPTYARFVNSMYDAGARISYILTSAADRGIIFTERGRARKSPRLYMEEEIIQVYQQAEKYISEHPEKFAEFFRDREVSQC